jgi:DNA invertase Pin-like site-specific DNA recombinase
MTVAIYLRVSTPTDKEDKKYRGQTTDNQLPDIDRFVAARGYDVYATYIDDVSAVKNRPQWDLMMKEAFQGRFKAIIVWKLDRFARSLKDLVVNLDLLHSWGVSFVSVTQNIDTTDGSATGRMLVHMLGMMAEFERSLISERVKAGMARKKKQGGAIGRTPVVFDVVKAMELHEGGMSWRMVAKHLGVKKTTLLERVKATTTLSL